MPRALQGHNDTLSRCIESTSLTQYLTQSQSSKTRAAIKIILCQPPLPKPNIQSWAQSYCLSASCQHHVKSRQHANQEQPAATLCLSIRRPEVEYLSTQGSAAIKPNHMDSFPFPASGRAQLMAHHYEKSIINSTQNNKMSLSTGTRLIYHCIIGT